MILEFSRVGDILCRFGRTLGYCLVGLLLLWELPAQAQRSRSVEAVTQILDQDGDRELSEQEVERASERILAADLNGDGAVSSEELSARVQYLRDNKPGILQEDFPYQMAAIGAPYPVGNVAKKGMAIRLEHGAAVLFDTDLVRMAAGWTGGLITTTGVTFDGSHGGFPRVSGKQLLGTSPVAGWANSAGLFLDEREAPFGPIDSDQARWNGYYLVGDQVVLSYRVHGHLIYEQPNALKVGNTVGFVRSFQVPAFSMDGNSRLSVLVAEAEGYSARIEKGRASLADGEGGRVYASLRSPQSGVSFSCVEKQIVLHIEPSSDPRLVQIVVWRSTEDPERLETGFRGLPVSMVDFTQGGPARWPDAVVTQGRVAADKTPDGAYVVDRLTPPISNPWNRRVRLGGFDFFADGRSAAFSTWDGDVWLLDGIDETLQNLRWKRFASGLFETLGLRIVDEVIYVSSRVGIMRLHDLNDDGTCDYYENFNNELTSSVGFHEFVFDLHTDSQGNFYYAKAGPVRGGGRGFGSRENENNRFGQVSAHAGTVVRVTPDGAKLDVYATGFRAPNGIGVSPDGQVTTGDNEGSWIPACPINWVQEGGFYGVEDLAHRAEIPSFDTPLCWLSKRDFDNSGGSQVWVTSDRWGPFEGELIHLSYGRCAAYLVMKQQIGDRMQGGVVEIPVSFASSAMRARFNESDGQLYVAGLKGWQTRAAQLSGFDRIRYTGQKVYSVRDLQVDSRGIHLTFTQPLDRELAEDVDSYAAKQWNYRRTSGYGSRDYRVSDEEKSGRDEVPITGAVLSEDGLTVTLKVENLQPVMQFEISYRLEAADGTRIRQKTLQTIHEIPEK